MWLGSQLCTNEHYWSTSISLPCRGSTMTSYLPCFHTSLPFSTPSCLTFFILAECLFDALSALYIMWNCLFGLAHNLLNIMTLFITINQLTFTNLWETIFYIVLYKQLLSLPFKRPIPAVTWAVVTYYVVVTFVRLLHRDVNYSIRVHSRGVTANRGCLCGCYWKDRATITHWQTFD